MGIRTKLLCLLALMSVPWSLLPGQTQADSRSLSIVAGSESIVVRFAAAELSEYLGRITGRTIPVDDSGARKIYVATDPHETPEAVRPAAAKFAGLKDDGFLIESGPAHAVILGKNERGALYGSYALLEAIGVRWYFPGAEYEVLPEGFTWPAALDVAESPAYPQRILFHFPAPETTTEDWIDFAAKARLNQFKLSFDGHVRDWYFNRREALLPEFQKRGLVIESGGHTLPSFLPRNLFDQHPEWFRRGRDGKRERQYNLNPFNQDALDYLSGGIAKDAARTPELALFHYWPDDIWGGGWTHEPGKENYTPSDQSLLTMNAILRRIREHVPEARLAYLAYHDTLPPPQVVKPDPGVVLFYAPRERCYAHSLDDASCGLNRLYSRALEEAIPAFGAENTEVFEYYVDRALYHVFNPPLPGVIAADARYYRGLGIPAVGSLEATTSQFLAPMVNLFLYPRALWNPQTRLEPMLEDYAERFYGDRDLAAYFRQLQAGLQLALQICEYTNMGDPWDEVHVDQESDDALSHRVSRLREAARGPLRRALETMRAAAARSPRGGPYRDRLTNELRQIEFSESYVRVLFHLLRGELSFRRFANDPADSDAALEALQSVALARVAWRKANKKIGAWGLPSEPRLPDAATLNAKARNLLDDGYELWSMYAYVDNVTGYSYYGPLGSGVVLLGEQRALPTRVEHPEIQVLDEFGAPFPAGAGSVKDQVVVYHSRSLQSHQVVSAVLAGLDAPR